MIIDEINTEVKHIKELVKDLRKEDLAEIKANLQNTSQNTEGTLRILEAIQFNPE